MASGVPNKSVAARASAILTGSEVAAARLDLNAIRGSRVSVDVTFTIGSLTDVTIRFYASMDGTTYKPIFVGAGDLEPLQLVLGATGNACIPVPPLDGWKFFRATAQGAGTATSSALALTYRFMKPGS